ncbi:hypothetical protein N5D52_29145, partial [Pseudomonas sp. GD03860]|nr:hypothetical protein [Pseudomonas sp. GD03860]
LTMFRNVFKRKNKVATEPGPDLRSQRPRAGEIRVGGLTETLFLSPLPVYTGQAQSSRRNFSEMNDTYLELGGNNRGMVEQGKILGATLWMVLFFAFVVPVLISIWLAIGNPPETDLRFFDIVGEAVQVFALGSLSFALPIGAYLYGMISSVYEDAKTYPVRFNRQRREVC